MGVGVRRTRLLIDQPTLTSPDRDPHAHVTRVLTNPHPHPILLLLDWLDCCVDYRTAASAGK